MPEHLTIPSLVLFAMALAGVVGITSNLASLWRLFRRRVPEIRRFPVVSILKPLAGFDDALEENLASHLAIDYPGEWEILLGVRSARDAAYPLAKRFADAHPHRVRLVLQRGEPGKNPKVNQLLTLTAEAKGEYLAISDSNVRVRPSWLREHVAALQDPKVALSSHVFAGVGEQTVGAAFDNMTIVSFAMTTLAMGDWMRLQQIVGKSLCIKRAVLDEIGGWTLVKDVLAEDQRLGRQLRKRGYRTALCTAPVENVQVTHSVDTYISRHSRWQMIRFLVIPHMVPLETLLNPFPWTVLAVAFSPDSPLAWFTCGAVALVSMGVTQLAAVLGRGHPFALRWMLLTPVRDLLMLGIWLRGATLREVNWRGNTLRVLWKTRLVSEEHLARLRRIKSSSRQARAERPLSPVVAGAAGRPRN